MPQMIVEETEVRMVKISIDESVLKRRDGLIDNGQCIGCEEPVDKKKARRGLCPACYQAAIRALKARRKTRTELIKQGKMLDRGQRGRPTTNKFVKEMSER